MVFLLSSNFIAAEKLGIWHVRKGVHVSTIAVDPANTSRLYIGTQEGIFRSTDGGSSWISISDGLKNTDVLTLAIDPVNTRTLYAGTRSGAFKSINGGDSWTLMESCLYEVAVSAIAIDPANPDTLYALARDAAWLMVVFMNQKSESRHESNLRDCAFKSTNGGEKWFSMINGQQENAV